MSHPVVLIATAKVHPGAEEEFTAWQARHSAAISKSPGFIGTDMIPPTTGRVGDPWTIIINFEDEASLLVWQKSPIRAELLMEVASLVDGGTFGETVSTDGGGMRPGTEVTEVVFSKVIPGKEDAYREWAVRIQAAQAKYPGYRGMYLQPPAGGKSGHWTTILRYDSTENLEAWMNAPERKKLLSETSDFIESEELMRIATSFPGWVPVDPMTGETPPNWKAAMLVLLGLFPIVMLEMKYLSPVLALFGIHASLGTFIGNAISVALTSFLTMPLFVNWFSWWLFPRGNRSAVTTKGAVIICALFALEVIVLWQLLPW